ncbi:hypothetical protein PMAYCL1PPCAC_30402 [Pristionchus mayeri]|uniref:SET domain-containing protein n=1 Tax=Pristionchus mayeri TaxID=1317129 RepID=A0AAN5IBP0_9BILA|nr:hypothetical protein PMAYCL1PPCAC_30402 [Pristionchus mayeri]
MSSRSLHTSNFSQIPKFESLSVEDFRLYGSFSGFNDDLDDPQVRNILERYGAVVQAFTLHTLEVTFFHPYGFLKILRDGRAEISKLLEDPFFPASLSIDLRNFADNILWFGSCPNFAKNEIDDFVETVAAHLEQTMSDQCRFDVRYDRKRRELIAIPSFEHETDSKKRVQLIVMIREAILLKTQNGGIETIMWKNEQCKMMFRGAPIGYSEAWIARKEKNARIHLTEREKEAMKWTDECLGKEWKDQEEVEEEDEPMEPAEDIDEVEASSGDSSTMETQSDVDLSPSIDEVAAAAESLLDAPSDVDLASSLDGAPEGSSMMDVQSDCDPPPSKECNIVASNDAVSTDYPLPNEDEIPCCSTSLPSGRRSDSSSREPRTTSNYRESSSEQDIDSDESDYVDYFNRPPGAKVRKQAKTAPNGKGGFMLAVPKDESGKSTRGKKRGQRNGTSAKIHHRRALQGHPESGPQPRASSSSIVSTLSATNEDASSLERERESDQEATGNIIVTIDDEDKHEEPHVIPQYAEPELRDLKHLYELDSKVKKIMEKIFERNWKIGIECVKTAAHLTDFDIKAIEVRLKQLGFKKSKDLRRTTWYTKYIIDSFPYSTPSNYNRIGTRMDSCGTLRFYDTTQGDDGEIPQPMPDYEFIPACVMDEDQENESLRSMAKICDYDCSSTCDPAVGCNPKTCACMTKSCLVNGKVYRPGGRKAFHVVECCKNCPCHIRPDPCPSIIQLRKIEYHVVNVENMGFALRVMENVQRGEVCIEFTGQRVSYVTDEEAKWTVTTANCRELQARKFTGIEDSDAMFALNPLHKGNAARFICHSYFPNVAFVNVFRGGDLAVDPRVFIFAEEPMEAGSLMYINYGTDFGISHRECRCTQELCHNPDIRSWMQQLTWNQGMQMLQRRELKIRERMIKAEEEAMLACTRPMDFLDGRYFFALRRNMKDDPPKYRNGSFREDGAQESTIRPIFFPLKKEDKTT